MNPNNDNVKILRNLLLDNYAEFDDIPDDLLLLALIKNSRQKLTHLATTYGSSNFERIEFLGDAVLDLIVAEVLFKNFNLKTPGDLTEMKSKLVRNSSLTCLAQNKNLCSLIISIDQYTVYGKNCADLFEAIIGALYYHLQNTHPNPIKFLLFWLNNEFDYENIISYMLNHPNENDVCNAIHNTIHDPIPTIYENPVYTTKSIIKPDITSFSALSMDELKSSLIEINKLIAKNTPVAYKTRLSNIYQKYKFGNVNYVTIEKGVNWTVGISCPSKPLCNENMIGVGTHYMRKEAEEMAAKKAYEYLTSV